MTPMRCLAVVLMLQVFPGCKNYRSPEIVVTGASPVERTEEALKLTLAMQLTNPNEESLELMEFSYEVEIDGKRAFEGMRAAQATLAPKDSRSILIPAIVPFQRLNWESSSLPASADYAVRGSLHYMTPGQVERILLDVGILRPKARFKGEGTLELHVP